MDIEKLTKSQIFLLTLLTSFVTSMATGIVTISLMDQAPPTITQSVSRIVQATVEKATPEKTQQPVAAAVAVPLQSQPAPQEKEPDLAQVVKGALPSVVRLYDTGGGGSFLGFGVVLDAGGTIVADLSVFGGVKKSANAKLADGTVLKVTMFASDTKSSLMFLSGASSTSTPHYSPATLSKEEPSIGESVIGLYGTTEPRIASGLVVAVTSPSASAMPLITTDLNTGFMNGSAPIIDRGGAFVGISTAASRTIDPAAFMRASVIATQYEAALAVKKVKAENLKNATN